MKNKINIQRRQLLKGVSLGGAFLASSSLWAAVSQDAIGAEAVTLHAVVTPNAAGKRFLASLKNKTHQVIYGSTDLTFIKQLQGVLATPNTKRVVAYLDSASATLVIDIARNANAKLLWEQSYVENGSYYTSILLEA